LKDGGLDLRLKLSSLAEVERWVLGWAGNARVLQPPELAESIAKAARKILQNSATSPPSA
jgi:predicted DNA-binding transcriptional regulator YafY